MKRPSNRIEKPPGYRDGAKTGRRVAGAPLVSSERKLGGQLWWAVVLLVGINFVYAPVRHYGFVNYDDPQYIAENPHVTGGLSASAARWAFTTGYQANWHPLTWLSHMADVQFFGVNPGAHHVINLVFHIASTLLLFSALWRMTGATRRSTFVAALFAVHPLHVESVAWLAERKDVLSTFFWMLVLSAYVGYVRQPRSARYIAVVLLFAVGLMTKPMLVTLPFVLLLLDFWPLGRLSSLSQSTIWRLVREKIPLLALTAISSAVTFMVQQRGGAMAAVEIVPVYNRIANACIAYVVYAAKMLWPARLAVLYPVAPEASKWWPIAALGLLAFSVLCLRWARRFPYLAVGWFWYVGTLVPVIGLVQVGRQAMADRYTYVPLVGLFLIIAFALHEALCSMRAAKYWFASAGAVSLAICVWLTNAQLALWRDSTTLWEHTLSVTADNSLAHFNLGAELERQGKIPEAISHYLEALRIEPEYADAHCNLASALIKSSIPDRLQQSRIHLTEAIRINPAFAEAYNVSGVNYMLQGQWNEAAGQFSEAARLSPDFALAHNNLGSALGTQGRLEEAISEYREAVRIDRNYAEAHENLGILLAKIGKTAEARTELAEALRLNPERSAAREWLETLSGTGRQQ